LKADRYGADQEPAAPSLKETTVTAASQTARPARTSRHPARTAWIFPGRIDLALVVNWHRVTVEAMIQDLKFAREREFDKDSTLIAGLRLLSAECSMALAVCRTQRDAASGRTHDGGACQ
jgi:hypothetical protein